MYTVYVIYNSKCKKTYTGQTESIVERIRQHNDHYYKSFTSRFPGKWVLIYKESAATRSDAIKREKQLKSGNGRKYVKQFIPG